jgi:predicted DNA-binding transcriptional regulator YafY
MGVTKNAYIRYKVLDELLQTTNTLTTTELTKRVNKKLAGIRFNEVGVRTIQKDLIALSQSPFNAPINTKGNYRYYTESDYSIMYIELTDEERNLLYEVLSTLGQFDGLKNFEWLRRYSVGLKLKVRPKVISFSTAPYIEGSNLLTSLFDVITNKQVIELEYHQFGEASKKYLIHPYLLKQYNNRWFLLCGIDKDDFIASFALDRIDGFTVKANRKYRECKEDLSIRYNDIIGVTIPKNKKFEYFLLWVDDKTFPYVDTKHIVRFQENISGKEELQLRSEYPQLIGGHFIRIYSLNNYELRRELCSYFSGLIVLKPENIQNEIFNEIKEMNERYLKLRT